MTRTIRARQTVQICYFQRKPKIYFHFKLNNLTNEAESKLQDGDDDNKDNISLGDREVATESSVPSD